MLELKPPSSQTWPFESLHPPLSSFLWSWSLSNSRRGSFVLGLDVTRPPRAKDNICLQKPLLRILISLCHTCYSPAWQSRSSSIADPPLGLAAELLSVGQSVSQSVIGSFRDSFRKLLSLRACFYSVMIQWQGFYIFSFWHSSGRREMGASNQNHAAQNFNLAALRLIRALIHLQGQSCFIGDDFRSFYLKVQTRCTLALSLNNQSWTSIRTFLCDILSPNQ